VNRECELDLLNCWSFQEEDKEPDIRRTADGIGD